MNPSVSKVSSARGAGLVNQSGLNNPSTVNRESYNTFDKSRLRLTTQRFDQALPVYKQVAVEGDVVRLRCSHDLRTYTLQSPLLSPLKMQRAFFQIPWSSICPNTWELLYRIPVKGEDIDFSDVLPHFMVNDALKWMLNLITNILNDESGTFSASIATDAILPVSVLFSRASLLKSLGVTLPFEEVGDALKTALIDYLRSDDVAKYDLDFTDRDNKMHKLQDCSTASVGDIFDFLDDYMDFGTSQLSFTDHTASESTNKLAAFKTTLSTIISASYGDKGTISSWLGSTDVNKSIDLMPIIAYQQVISQFYTNSHIDDVYSAKEWSRGMTELCFRATQAPTTSSLEYDRVFVHEGLEVPYDVAAGNSMARIFGQTSNIRTWNLMEVTGQFFFSLFRIQRSLRYGDYFTSCRTSPLAVGDVNVAVSSDNKVSAIDTNRVMWIQRLLNAVNRCSQSIYDYIGSMTGVSPERRVPQPNFVASESFNIGSMEVENTAENQGNVVTLLRNTESRFMFEAYVDEPSYIIGINTFSALMVYPETTDKDYFMTDRLEWFNSFMQHTGDQTLDLCELTVPPTSSDYKDAVFGYQLRYAEFKNALSQAVGGFIDGSLPSWAIIFKSVPGVTGSPVISEQFIRNTNRDLDPLYSSLTGSNDSNRFHFILALNFSSQVNSKQQAYPTLM